MDGLWSNPRVAYDEEADGDIRTFGTGALFGYGVGGDTHMLGPGRLTGDDHEDINWNGFNRTNQYEWKHDTGESLW